ncbi:nuclear transport factor 2 family protein [Actinoplanes sp. L3-i22]|uniref:nuclear transport factor 2 family protein n=1 Tax=Actinoplanes sp. L3-i22 TaxID=2836373 RepID=UPI001C75FC1F|nr:nuclear transport factor 2 family protein [Actinoplanes sp. L3-i22]BCY08158.1 polyketide cyclase [Actinoplanes sp. L3-i22]
MSIDLSTLPAPVRAYLTADSGGSPDAVVQAFTPDATVVDEGRTRVGHTAIRAWRAEVAAKYTYTAEVTGIRPDGADGWVVAVRLRGDFPGGVADVDEHFTLRDGRIAGLTIG